MNSINVWRDRVDTLEQELSSEREAREKAERELKQCQVHCCNIDSGSPESDARYEIVRYGFSAYRDLVRGVQNELSVLRAENVGLTTERDEWHRKANEVLQDYIDSERELNEAREAIRIQVDGNAKLITRVVKAEQGRDELAAALSIVKEPSCPLPGCGVGVLRLKCLHELSPDECPRHELSLKWSRAVRKLAHNLRSDKVGTLKAILAAHDEAIKRTASQATMNWALKALEAVLLHPEDLERPDDAEPGMQAWEDLRVMLKRVLPAHDAALVNPPVEALRKARACYPENYVIRITEILDAALLAHKERTT